MALMFTPWIKRTSLKRTSKSKTMVVAGESPSLIMLLSLSALCVVVGVYVVQKDAGRVSAGKYADADSSCFADCDSNALVFGRQSVQALLGAKP